jgi:chaperone protein EcpD
MKHAMVRFLRGASLAGLLLLPGYGFANIQVAGTRFIYPAAAREIIVNLSNAGQRPALVQTWLDKGDPMSAPGADKLPFIVTPPLMRIEPHQGQTLRIAYIGGTLPKDRESVFWLNVLEVPPKASKAQGQNIMQIAFRSRMKIFLRPDNLMGRPEDAATQITWDLVKGAEGYSLRAYNKARYHVSFSSLSLKANGRSYSNTIGGMVEPGGRFEFPLKDLNMSLAGGVIEGHWISDYGTVKTQSYTLNK